MVTRDHERERPAKVLTGQLCARGLVIHPIIARCTADFGELEVSLKPRMKLPDVMPEPDIVPDSLGTERCSELGRKPSDRAQVDRQILANAGCVLGVPDRHCCSSRGCA